MGIYLNPGNDGFKGIRNDEYVDKSGMIALMNQVIDTPRRLTCVSRPRRFGKSFAAKMLCAYYDKTCDSSDLFDDLIIAEDEQYREYLNKYDVIYLDIKDDVLTLLIHLGYLAYDEESQTVRIPNEELRREFARSIREVKRDETIQRVRESDRLIYDTVHGNADAVADQIEKIHAEETAVLFYNDEQALRSVIKIAYFSYKDHYLKFEELPGGDGYADIVYLPKKDSMLPALVIEMKWNQSAKGAIAQIKDKKYPDAIKDYGGEVLLVGINYDKHAPTGKRKHECVIEKMI